VIFQDLAFPGREQPGALAGLVGQRLGQRGNIVGTALEDHVHDHDAVAEREPDGVAMPGHRVR
jgi:hypothetical protein